MTEPQAPLVSDCPGLRPNRACRNCVQIKAKCVPLDASMTICQRCHRLEKQCATPAPVSRKRQRDKSSEHNFEKMAATPTPSSLQDMSTATNEPTPNTPRTEDVRDPAVTNIPEYFARLARPGPGELQDVGSSMNAPEYFQRVRTRTAGSVFDVSPEIGHAFIASNHEALFAQYLTEMAKYFPFVVISPTISPATIFRERPFLYTCCVMNAAHRDPPLQSRIGRDILRYVSEHMFLAGEKSLDLLQGLLVMTAWYHVYTHNNPQLMNVLHLARALLVDLGLNGAPGMGVFRIKMSGDATRMIHGNSGQIPDPQEHNLEGRRACLAIYYIHCRYSTSFRRLDPTLWTNYLEECCEVLERTAEYQSDAYAVGLVRLCHLIDRFTGSEGLRPGVSMPVQTYAKLASKDIEKFIQALPIALQSDNIMKAQLLNAEMALLEPIIVADSESAAHKVEALYTCLKSTIAFFDTFVALPVQDMPHLPFLVWVMVAQALDIIATLSLTPMEGWDLAYARGTPGFISVTTDLKNKMGQVQHYEDRHHPTSRSIRFKLFANRMDKFIEWYEGKLQSESDGARQSPTNLDTSDQLPGAVPLVSGEFSDTLWQDFLADWPRLENDLNFL